MRYWGTNMNNLGINQYLLFVSGVKFKNENTLDNGFQDTIPSCF